MSSIYASGVGAVFKFCTNTVAYMEFANYVQLKYSNKVHKLYKLADFVCSSKTAFSPQFANIWNYNEYGVHFEANDSRGAELTRN